MTFFVLNLQIKRHIESNQTMSDNMQIGIDYTLCEHW